MRSATPITCAILAWSAHALAVQTPPPYQICERGVSMKRHNNAQHAQRPAFSSPLVAIKVTAARDHATARLTARLSAKPPQSVEIAWEIGVGDGKWTALDEATSATDHVVALIPVELISAPHLFVQARLSEQDGTQAAICGYANARTSDPVISAFAATQPQK